MNLPDHIQPRYELLLREPLVPTATMRKQVAAFMARLRELVAADELDAELEQIDAVASTLEGMLKRVSRKTTPLHHRLIHATARYCILDDQDGRPINAEHVATNIDVVNETLRVIRRPDLKIPTGPAAGAKATSARAV